MKVKIVYIGCVTETVIINGLSFVDFCKSFFKKKIYISLAKNELNLAINTDNVIFVEEIK